MMNSKQTRAGPICAAMLLVAVLLSPHAAEAACTDPAGPGVDWSNCDLTGRTLEWTDLTRANLSYADLTGVNLTEAILTFADLRGRRSTMPI